MNTTYNSPNFTGKYITSVQILKNKKPIKASLVELTKKDANCIEDVAELWNTRIINKLAESVYIPLKDSKNPAIYAISTQDKSFEKVSPKKVLGIFEVTEKENLYTLEFLEVKPTQTYENQKRIFSEVGKRCMDYIKSKFRHRDVEIYAVKSACPFYEKMGCIKQPKDNSTLRYIIPKHE